MQDRGGTNPAGRGIWLTARERHPKRSPSTTHAPVIGLDLIGGQRLTSNSDDTAVRADVAAFADDYISHGRIHDHAIPVDEGGATNVQPDAVVDVDGRLHEGRLGL